MAEGISGQLGPFSGERDNGSSDLVTLFTGFSRSLIGHYFSRIKEYRDNLLKDKVEEYNECWEMIAKHFPERSDVQCQQRWHKVVNPDLVKGPWTKEGQGRCGIELALAAGDARTPVFLHTGTHHNLMLLDVPPVLYGNRGSGGETVSNDLKHHAIPAALACRKRIGRSRGTMSFVRSPRAPGWGRTRAGGRGATTPALLLRK
ncbi:Myb- protein B [Homalodisca vitripennis]|nr:Myb- protein B [Homalodisca vitripennis]